jgi:hypothetical protein
MFGEEYKADKFTKLKKGVKGQKRAVELFRNI